MATKNFFLYLRLLRLLRGKTSRYASYNFLKLMALYQKQLEICNRQKL